MEILDREEYEFLVKDIIENKEFQKTKNIVHHSLNRFDHSKRVSFYSYKIAKMLRLSYDEVARAALLHDFFLVDNHEINVRERANTMVNHPKYALAYSEKFFNLTEKEKDIIVTHMFPVCPTRVPKYAESWLVDIVDDVVSFFEQVYVKRNQLASATSFIIGLIIKIH